MTPSRWEKIGWRLAATRRLWRSGARPHMQYVPPPPVELIPVGQIDGPGPETTVRREALQISGWALFTVAPLASVEMWLGEKSLGRARLGFLRPDIDEIYEFPAALISGFHLTADLTDWDEEETEAVLRAVATSTAGERYELAPVPLTIAAPKRPKRRKLAPPAERTPFAPTDRGRRLGVFTHQLNLGGAQLYLLDLMRELVKDGRFAPTVISALDGETRVDLEALGIPVHVSSFLPMDELHSHIGRLEELAHWTAERDFEVALVNTSTALSFPGAEVTSQLQIPTVWAIHESFAPPVLWSDIDIQTRERAEAALGVCAAAVFEAEATQRLYEPPLDPSQGLTIPYGLDFAPIARARAGFDLAATRGEAEIPENAEVLLCVGTIEPRKAQIQLAQAFELIAGRHPQAQLVFVGGAEKPDSEALGDYIDSSRLSARMKLIPITPDVQSWYGLSDILVCASDVESLPRTVLEAMAWETPVLATSVFGLPELITDGESGWLCEHGDVAILAEALDRVLSTTPEQRQAIGKTARALVEERHSLVGYGEKMAELLEWAAAGDDSPPPRHVAAT